MHFIRNSRSGNRNNSKNVVKGFQTIVFIFIVISTTFWLICPQAFYRCLSNSNYTLYWVYSALNKGRSSNSNEDNSLKILNDKNHQASSQKFRQLVWMWFQSLKISKHQKLNKKRNRDSITLTFSISSYKQ